MSAVVERQAESAWPYITSVVGLLMAFVFGAMWVNAEARYEYESAQHSRLAVKVMTCKQ